MNRFPTERQITPHWLMRLFGARSAIFKLTDAALQIETENGKQYWVPIESLGEGSTFKQGLLFSRVSFPTDQGKLTFRGLPKAEGKALYQWAHTYWFQQIAPQISKVAGDIKELLAGHYPSHSRIQQALPLAKAALKEFKIVPDRDLCDELDVHPFEYVAQVAQGSGPNSGQLQDSYLADQLAKFEQFFDQVESKPLTARQREACVADEDNNLVLAGAGTGKTSVMVGRAGYLIQSGQARPEEILMLAFGNKAAAEMQERITLRLGDCGITASTFHKLGKEIIAAVEGKQPSLTPLAEDDLALAHWVDQWFEELMLTPGYRKLALKYFQDHLYPEANPFDFKSAGEYFDFIIANDIRTLKGEMVKSLGECLVANHLFKLGINYQYEAAYEHETATPEFRQYQPDFYLPDLGIYIEYFGTDRKGNTAPYVDKEKYHEGMQWKRDLHRKFNTPLMELFHYQWCEGTLFDSIEQQLEKLEVSYEPLPPEAVLETLREFGAVSQFASLLTDLLRRYRANCYEDGQAETAIAKAPNADLVGAALKLLLPIVDKYQALLDGSGQIDFDDMIGKAIGYVKSGRFSGRWKYILVDEFQDISEPRARLIRSLRDSAAQCSLFCVGDDWQAIYRFTGSDLTYTTAFAEKFGVTRTTALDLTFRFNDGISDVATQFVLQNPAQVKKELRTLRQVDQPAVSLLRSSEPNRIRRVLQRIAEIAKPGSTVYLLSRYSFHLLDQPKLGRLRRQFPSLSLDCHTMHASKGMEADYVIILGLETGKHGFPSEKITNPLLEALLPPLEPYEHAEERRLFYVALTRAKHRAYLIADMTNASGFVVELLQKNYKIEMNEFDASLAQKLFQLIKCVKCKTGTMVPRQGKFGTFFGCTKYPLCSHKERGCPKCGTQMHRVDRFKVCIDPECKGWVPICPECGAEMAWKKGKRGYFWGCRNYRHGGGGCNHTENEIVFERQET